MHKETAARHHYEFCYRVVREVGDYTLLEGVSNYMDRAIQSHSSIALDKHLTITYGGWNNKLRAFLFYARRRYRFPHYKTPSIQLEKN